MALIAVAPALLGLLGRRAARAAPPIETESPP
jgi:hypothetical protein